MSWYYTSNGKNAGPSSETEVRFHLSSGSITPTDKVKPPGHSDWIPSSEASIHFTNAPSVSSIQKELKRTNISNLDRLRDQTCYPAFRAFISVASIIGYFLAASVFVAGFIFGGTTGAVPSLIISIAIALMIKVSVEASLMLADIADAVIDSNSKHQ